MRACLALSHLTNALLLLALSLLLAPHALANPTVPQGGSVSFAKTGTDAPASGLTWDIVRAGSSIATSSASGGWSVSYNATSTQFTVAAPASAPIAANYEVRYGSGGPNPMGLLRAPRLTGRRYASRCPVPGGGPTSGSVSAFFDVVAAGPLQISSLSVAPATVLGGNSSVGTITLTGAAPAGGAVVPLASNNAAASVPASVTVPQGQSSVTFPISTQTVTASTPVAISGQYAGATQTATLTVVPSPTVTNLALNPAGVTGGNGSTGTVTLSVAAPADVSVSLSTTNSAASVPATVVVSQGSTQASFSISTTAVATQAAGTVTASLGGASVSKPFTVYPPEMPENGFTVSPGSVLGGQPATGNIVLTGPAPSGGLAISINCLTSGAAQLNAFTPFPASVTVPAGASSYNFPFQTSTVNTPLNIVITATVGNETLQAPLRLLPANLRLTAVIPLATLRLQWDQPLSDPNATFALSRDGALLATLPGSTLTYDDTSGFVSGQKITYTLTPSNSGQVDMEMVIPYLSSVVSNQAVDSRLDLRYSENHLVDHNFGATIYRGGLFAGFASDPSRVGRSFARFAPTGGQPSNTGLRVGGVSAYFTRMAGDSAASVDVGCQIVPEPSPAWDYSKLVWSLTDPSITPGAPAFSPSSAPSVVSLHYDPANPAPGWQQWDLGNVFRQDVISGTPFTVAWAGMNENTNGWAYFAKKEYKPGLAPCATWAWSVPYPLSVCLTTSGATVGGRPDGADVTLTMHGVGKDDSVTVMLSGNSGGASFPVTVTGLQRTFHVPANFVYYDEAGWYITVTATCNGVSVSATVTYLTPPNQSCAGTGGIGSPGGGAGGGGAQGGG